MRKSTFPRWLAMALGLATVMLLVGGVAFYRAQEHEQRHRAEAELLAISQLKADQIAGWRAERLADAAVLMESPFFAEGVARWFASPEAEDVQHVLTCFRSLQEHYYYQDVLLVDASGQVRLSLSGHAGPLHADLAQALEAAWRARQPVLTDLRAGPADGVPQLELIAPLVAANAAAEPVGAVILQADARQFLYPLIASWPTPSRSAESLLVRRDGEDVLFLNDLRHQEATALTLRIPLSRTDVPAVQAVLGREGVLHGRDYRGIEVLSTLKAVPDSPWFLVAKVDAAEVFAVWRFLSVLILALLILLAAGAVAVAALVWQRNEKAHYRALAQAEAALRASEARHRTTLMSVGDAVIATDAQGHVELLNPVAEVFTGWRQAEAMGRTLGEVFHIINEETRQAVENPVLRVLREGIVVGLANHTLLIARDGTERAIADAGAPIRDGEGNISGVVLVFRDQTAARAAQEALNASEIRYRRLFEAAKDGILILAADTGVIIDVNPFLADLLGFSREQVLGRTLWELGFFKDIAANQAKFAELCQKKYVRYEDLPLITADGRRLDVEFVSNLDQIDQRAVIQCSIRDITVRKQAEEALRASEEQLRQAQKTEAVGRLAGGVAHDLNNTLTAIFGYVDLVRAQLPAEHKAHANLDGLEQAAEQASGVMRGLLTFSGRSSPTKKTVALGPLLTETIHMLRHMLPASIEIMADVPKDTSLAVYADPTQIQQVLINLALNARDAMPEGGQLGIALSEEQDTLDPEHVTASRLACITVRDNGVGIPPEVCPRIFEPFFTTKAHGQGTGLGLAIVHGIVRDHGGRIEVDSEPGRGTTVRVLLPAVAPESADMPVAAPGAVPPGRRAPILLAEDQGPVRRVLATVLDAIGYEVVEAADGEELQQRFREAAGRLRLLIFDLDLPKRSGRVCLDEIRATGCQTPAILITGEVEAGLEKGLDEHTVLLRKPFRAAELAGLAGRMLALARPTEVRE